MLAPVISARTPSQANTILPQLAGEGQSATQAAAPGRSLTLGSMLRWMDRDGITAQSALDVFHVEDCEVTLWLLLHNVPSTIVAQLLANLFRDPGHLARSQLRKGEFLKRLARAIEHFAPGLAAGMGNHKDPGNQVQHLLIRQHIFNGGRWVFRQVLKLAESCDVLNATEDVQSAIESRYGYCDGEDQTVERWLIRLWLEKIRQSGRLADALDDREQQQFVDFRAAHQLQRDEKQGDAGK
jgi:hypothetical protein